MSNKQQITNNIKIENNDLDVLKAHFGDCFDKNGNFVLQQLAKKLADKEINFSNESYGLDWLGKSYARLLASDAATTLLQADESHNNIAENKNAQNLLLKGDNLEVLKHLSQAYHQKIKMIYIDPPYNTGSDGFVYHDDRKFTTQQLCDLAGVSEERAQRILNFTQSASNSHSAWLTFMYPRLYIAKQLLKDDGVIFVSIDDNEVAQLRLLMDEIFGEENFIGVLLWKKTENIKMDSKFFSENKDYILSYKKQNLNEFNKILSTEERYKLQDDKGKYYLRKLDSKSSSYSKSLDYVIKHNGVEYYAGGSKKDWEKRRLGANKKDAIWLWSKKTFEEGLKNNEIVFQNGNVYNKVRYDGIAKKPYTDFLTASSGQSSQKKLDALFDGQRLFDHPKPVDLILDFLNMASSNSSDIILDFFAGSGTTGDAVMHLNAEDGGERKYILVQLPELIDQNKSKTAYDFVKNDLQAEPTIFEITKERLLRAAKKINADLDKKVAALTTKIQALQTQAEISEVLAEIENNQQQIAQYKRIQAQNTFKVFETLPIWVDYNFEADQYSADLVLFEAEKLTEQDIAALLITWKTYDGMPLTQDLEAIDLGGYTAHLGNNKLYLMSKGFTTDHLKTLLERLDSDNNFHIISVIAFGYHLDSKSMREIAENTKSYANKKNIDIDFIIRY